MMSLAQASDNLQAAASVAAETLKNAADEVVATVQQTATKAIASVHSAIDDANDWVLELTSMVITDLVGEEKAEFYDLESLKGKWSRR